MKRSRHRRIALISLLLLALLIAVPVVMTWRAVRQARLNQALIAAIKRNDMRGVQQFLVNGADVDACEGTKADLSMWQVLLKGLFSRMLKRNPSSPALCVAIENGCDLAMIRSLLERGANPDAVDRDGQTALWDAKDLDRPDDVITPLLIRYGADVNRPQPGPEGRTLLMEAAGWGFDTDIDLLMQAGARVDARNGNGWTALMYALDSCRPDTIRPLLKWRADVNVQFADGKTALAYARKGLTMHWATPFNHESEKECWSEIVSLLKVAGAR